MKRCVAGRWWRSPLIPAFGRQRQEDLCELETNLVYRVSFTTARATQRNPVPKTNKPKRSEHSRVWRLASPAAEEGSRLCSEIQGYSFLAWLPMFMMT